jgi:Resolvase, N terminal domain
LIRLSEEQGWRLIITEMGIDTRTPTGKAMAHLAVIFAELERDFIRMRTGEAMQVKKENGVTLGKPRSTLGTWWPAFGRERMEGKTHTPCPLPEQGRCADCAGCARLVHRPFALWSVDGN